MKSSKLLLSFIVFGITLAAAVTSADAQSTGNLNVTVRNANGSTVSGARVLRYTSDWTYIEYKLTNASGMASWSNISIGTYNLEAYYTGTFFGEEYWGDTSASVTSGNTTNATINRIYPYIESITFRNHSTGAILNPTTQITPGTTIRAEVVIRNKVSVSLNVRVQMLLDRSQSSPYDSDQTSGPLSVGSNSTRTFTLTYTPAQTGTWYRAFTAKTTLQNGNTTITDAWQWGQAFVVQEQTGNLNVTVRNANSSMVSGARVLRYTSTWSYIDYKVTNSSGVAPWSNISTGTYNLEAYYTGTFFGEEYWGGASASVASGNTTNVTINRIYPYIESITFRNHSTGAILNPTTQITPGTTIRAEVVIRNKVSVSLNVRVQMLLDRSQSSPYDSDQTSGPLSVGSNSTRTFTLTYTPTQTGTWYRAFAAKTTLQNGNTTLTDAWQWGQAFNLTTPAGSIIAFNPPTGMVQRGQQVQATVIVKNAATTARSFWVGLSFAEPGATLPSWPEGWYDVRPQQTKNLAANEEQTLTFEFTIPSSLVPGSYTASTGIWEGYNYDEHKMIGIDSEGRPKVGGEAYGRRDYIPSFSIGPYPITSSPLLDQLISAAQEALLGYDIHNSYIGSVENGHEKVLFYLGATVDGSISGASVSAGGTILIDLADLAHVTPEGRDSTVTIWIDGNAGVGVGASMGIDVEFGVTTHNFKSGEFALADYRESLSGALEGQFLGLAFTAASYSTTGGWTGPKLQWTTHFAIKAAITGTAQSWWSYEVHYGEIIHAINEAQGTDLRSLVTSMVRNLYDIKGDIFKPTTNDDGAWSLGIGDGSWNSGSWTRAIRSSKASTATELFGAFFFIDVPSGKNNLTFRLDGGEGNPNLYAKKDSRPTRSDYYASSSNPGPDDQIVITSPESGKWYFLVDAQVEFENVSYFVRLDPQTPAKPILASPPDGSLSISTSPTLSWNASSGAVSYRLQVSKDSTFSVTDFDQSNITATSQQVPGLSYNTTHHWRVNVTNAGGSSDWSTVWSFTTESSPTSVEQISNEVPTEFRLGQNYPNPFNPATTIEFDLPISSFVTLRIYNSLGKEIVTLISENLQAGKYKVKFNANSLASGLYLYRLHSDSFVRSKKMIFIK